MADNKNPNQKQDGEKQPGKYHYNPGNMAGKTVVPVEPEQKDADRTDKSDAPATK